MGFGFLAPWFLAGLLALGLPLWLHLLRRRENPPREFPSLMLFERRIQSSVRQRRLRYLLLWAVRSFLLAALILAFARPYLETSAVGGSNRLVVLALDESFSMRQGERMARARQLALQQLGKLRPGERVQVMAFASGVRVLGDATGDPASLRGTIATLQPGDSRTAYAELARALRVVAQSAGGLVEAHVFTDLQRSGLPASLQDLSLPENVKLVLHAVSSDAPANWTVEAVVAPACVYEARGARIQASIASFANESARKRVSLVLNGRVTEAREVEAPPNGRVAVEFVSGELRYGVNRGEVRIEPTDAFPQDDKRLFAIERADARPALFVHESRDRRAWLYFRTALEASGQGAFRLEEATTAQVASLNPASYAFVVLSDAAWLPENFERALRAYMEGGGAVLVALGPSIAARGRLPLLGTAIQADGQGTAIYQKISELDRGHPVLARSEGWEQVRFYRSFHAPAGEARVLARLADKTPLLVERRVGAGRLLVFASTFDNLSNDLPLHAVFVPFVERMAAYLGELEERVSSLPVDAHLPLRTLAGPSTALEVVGPDGKRALSLEEAATAESIALKRAGFFEIRRGGGRQQTVAVNPDPRESDLSMIPEEVLAIWRGQATATAHSPVQTARQRQGVWRWLLLGALLAAIAEAFLGNRYLTAKSEAV